VGVPEMYFFDKALRAGKYAEAIVHKVLPTLPEDRLTLGGSKSVKVPFLARFFSRYDSYNSKVELFSLKTALNSFDSDKPSLLPREGLVLQAFDESADSDYGSFDVKNCPGAMEIADRLIALRRLPPAKDESEVKAAEDQVSQVMDMIEALKMDYDKAEERILSINQGIYEACFMAFFSVITCGILYALLCYSVRRDPEWAHLETDMQDHYEACMDGHYNDLYKIYPVFPSEGKEVHRLVHRVCFKIAYIDVWEPTICQVRP